MKDKRHRRYDEHELAAILDRAAKLQGSDAMIPLQAGRTLDEIRAIAVEAGMDAACVEAAAQAFHAEEMPRLPVFGRSPRMELTTVVDGELDAEDRSDILGVVKRSLDATGRTRESAREVEWRRIGWFGRELVVLASHKGKTRIEVRGRYRRGFVASFVSGGFAGGMAAMGLLDLFGVLQRLDAWSIPLVLAAAFGAGRAIWGWFSGAKEKTLRRLTDRIAELAEHNTATARALPPRSEE